MINANNLASGGQPQGQTPQVQVAPGALPTGGDQQNMLEALELAIQASMDEQGFVDIKVLAQVWPQISKQVGVNIPFQTVLQMIQANPQMIESIVKKLQVRGIVVNGQRLGVEQLAGMGSGGAASGTNIQGAASGVPVRGGA